MLQRFWLIFAQTTAIALGVWLVVRVLAPGLLPSAGTLPNNHAPAVIQVAPDPMVVSHATLTYRDAVQRALPAMVNIQTSQAVSASKEGHPLLQRFFGEEQGSRRRAASLGSGVLIDSQGFVVTNYHVVEAAEAIEVALADGRSYAASVVGADPETDLAVLKIEAKSLAAIRFAESKTLQVGDVVLAIGNPYGFGQTVTMGIVSALGRTQLGLNTFENFIQTDAPINPGNSGGALVNTDGDLVGINSAIYSKDGGSMGIAFAIPAATVREVVAQIIQNGRVVRGWVGVATQDLNAELARSFGMAKAQGVLVAGIVRGSPADKSGLLPGDVLLKVDGLDVTDTNTMLNRIAATRPGTQVRMELLRQGQAVSLTVEVGQRPIPKRLSND